MKIRKIILRGQTGADIAALDAAMKLGVPHGGWIPRGRPTEDGVLPSKYHLKQMSTFSYPKRTEQNLIDSDGTVIFSHGKLTGGSKLTERLAKKHSKPCIHFDLFENIEFMVASNLSAWVVENEIETLNIAGSRASKDPEIYGKVFMIVESGLLLDLKQAEPGQKLTDYSVDQYMKHIPVLGSESDAAVESVVNSLSLKDQVAIANMDDFEVDVLQAVFEKYIIASTSMEPENDVVKAAWEKLKGTHRIRSVK